MRKPLPHVTAAELRIMKVLWKRGQSTVRQVLESLPAGPGERPAYTTVMTMMKQLAEKGALRVDRDRQPYVYSPAVRRDQVLRARVVQLLQNVFDGRAEDLVLHLADEADLSPEDFQRIVQKIRERERIEKGGGQPHGPRGG
jgi:BlaI family penicillinase repressor